MGKTKCIGSTRVDYHAQSSIISWNHEDVSWLKFPKMIEGISVNLLTDFNT